MYLFYISILNTVFRFIYGIYLSFGLLVRVRTFGEGWCSATRCLRPTTAHSSGCAAALYFEATPIQFQTGSLVGEWRTAKRPANGTPLFSGGLFVLLGQPRPVAKQLVFVRQRETVRVPPSFSNNNKYPIFQTHVRLVVYDSRGRHFLLLLCCFSYLLLFANRGGSSTRVSITTLGLGR